MLYEVITDREVQEYEIRKKLIRDQTLADGAATLVQAAATHISKMPANDSTFIKSLEKLIESMSDDQLKTFMGSLSGTQQALFVSILEKLKSKGKENSEDTSDKKGEESVITSYSIHYTKLYEFANQSALVFAPVFPTGCAPGRCFTTSVALCFSKLRPGL